jgi:hypothetical protein
MVMLMMTERELKTITQLYERQRKRFLKGLA